MSTRKLHIVRNDELPAFGAFWSVYGPDDPSKPLVIALNVEALMSADAVEYEDGSTVTLTLEDRKRHAITTLMHEFGHAMEKLFSLPHNEEAIRKAEDEWIGNQKPVPETAQ